MSFRSCLAKRALCVPATTTCRSSAGEPRTRRSQYARRRIRLWIETGAAYPGTCAAMEVTAMAYHVPDFRPNVHYVREMKRYGILPADFDLVSPLDVYATDQAYWRQFWYRP